MTKKYLVTAEFCSQVEIDQDDLKNENYDDLISQFVKTLKDKINNHEIIENITEIVEDKYE